MKPKHWDFSEILLPILNSVSKIIEPESSAFLICLVDPKAANVF